jgi:1,4-dihydroxy-2-naphthoate octaprenyltransferase
VSRPSSDLARWVAAARPKTLVLAVAPVLAGIGLAIWEGGGWAPGIGLLTLLAAVAIQVGTNLHNDAADFERGTDGLGRLGPPRASAEGWFSVGQVKRAAHLAFALAFVIGIGLVVRGGWPILLLGLGSLLAGYAYTGGPRPIAYGPFGEVFVLFFFGVAAVGGSYYLQTLSFGGLPLGIGVALGLPAAAVLVLNNYRDMETDEIAGRRTLCHLLGRPRARVLYSAMLIAPIGLLLFAFGHQVAWPVLLALPASAILIRALTQGAIGQQINPLLGQTGLFEILLVGLLLAGLGLDRWG